MQHQLQRTQGQCPHHHLVRAPDWAAAGPLGTGGLGAAGLGSGSWKLAVRMGLGQASMSGLRTEEETAKVLDDEDEEEEAVQTGTARIPTAAWAPL